MANDTSANTITATFVISIPFCFGGASMRTLTHARVMWRASPVSLRACQDRTTRRVDGLNQCCGGAATSRAGRRPARPSLDL